MAARSTFPVMWLVQSIAQMNPMEQRDRLISHYDDGMINEADLNQRLVELMIGANDDELTVELCRSLPDHIRPIFRNWLCHLSDHEYKYRWVSIGDQRTPEQIDSDGKRHQVYLQRIGPRLLQIL